LRLENNDFWAISHSKSNLNAGNRLALKYRYEFVFQIFCIIGKVGVLAGLAQMSF
jgi:hypothetical protein